MEYHWSILAILAIVGSVASQSYVVTPQPTTGVLGGTAEFTCEVEPADTYFEWQYGTTNIYFRLGDNEQYPGPGGQGRYSVAWTGGEYTLTINDLQITDAEEQYGCKVNTQGAEHASLIVLGQPSLSSLTTSKVEGTIATYSCEAEFGGPGIDDITDTHFPTISLYQGNNEITGELTTREPDGTNQYVLIRQSNITLTNAIDGEILMCVTTTQVSSEMTNASMTIEVEFGVTDMGHEPVHDDDIYEVGEVITCTARGRPTVTFSWVDSDGQEPLSDNAELTLTESMVGPRVFVCEAENTVDGESKTESHSITITVVSPGAAPSEPGSDSWKIAVGVSVPIIIIIIGLIVALVVYTFVFKKKLPGNNRPNNNIQMNNSVDGSQRGKTGMNPGYKQDSMDDAESGYFPEEKVPAFTIHSPDRYQNAPNLPFNGDPPPNYGYQIDLLGTGAGSNMSLPLDDSVNTNPAAYTKPTPTKRSQSQEQLKAPEAPREGHVSFDDAARDDSDDDDDDDDDDRNENVYDDADYPPPPPAPLSNNQRNQFGSGHFQTAVMPSNIPDTVV